MCLIKNLITKNQVFGLKIIIFFIEVDDGKNENYDSDEKERKDMFKNHNFKIFGCNPNNPEFDLFRFLGEIILYISKLHEENALNYWWLWKNSRSEKIKR